MKIPAHVIDEIFMRIEELSSIEFQYKVWIQNSVENHVSCYADLHDALVQDLGTEDLVKADSKEYGLTLEFQKELALMLFLLAAYNDKKLTNSGYKKRKQDIEIIKDPKWEKIAQQAKKVLNMYQIKKTNN